VSRIKRRASAILAALLLAVLCWLPAYAGSGETYYLKEVDAEIPLPLWEDYYHLFPDMPEDHPDLEYLRMTPEEVNEILRPNGILFQAIRYDLSCEITVQAEKHEKRLDYRRIGEAERGALAESTRAELEAEGCTVYSVAWEEGEHALWLVVEFALADGSGMCQYHTVKAGKSLSFTAISTERGALAEEVCEVLKAMALGTRFGSADRLGRLLVGAAVGAGVGVVIMLARLGYLMLKKDPDRDAKPIPPPTVKEEEEQ